MKKQFFGEPKVNLDWFLQDDSYTRDNNLTTLDSEKGKKQLIDTILMLIEQGHEIRLGSDGCCLLLEANYVDNENDDCSYQFVDGDETVVVLRKQLPDRSFILCLDEDDYKCQLEQFLEEHPYYVKNEDGNYFIDDSIEDSKYEGD